ncbi:MAG: DUF6580 family putative transport protein [Terriglobales bacterium]
MLAYLFVVLAVVARFVSIPVSYAPVGAALLFFGARGPRKQGWIPVVLLAGADLLLTKFVYAYPYTLDHVVTIAFYAAVMMLGTLLREKSSPARIGGAAVALSVGFFVVSNFAVWLVWNMYPHTLGGLATCYAAALPFYRNQAISELVGTAVMFSIPALLELMKPQTAKA